jgi:hypothetical protein
MKRIFRTTSMALSFLAAISMVALPAGANSGSGSGDPTYVSREGGSGGSGSTSPSGEYIPPPTNRGSGGASQAAKGAAAQQAIAMGMSLAMAGYFYSQCSSTNKWACVFAALSAAQAASLALSSKTNSGVADQLASRDQSYAFNDGVTGANNDGTSSGGTSVMADAQKIMAEMSEKGYKVSPDGKTMTFPDGRSVATSAITDEGALSSAGFSESDIQAGRATLAAGVSKANDKMRAVQMTAEGGGGGGGGSGRSVADDGSGGPGKGHGGNFNFGQKKDPKKPNLSGMSKNFGSDKIGVAGDDIFEMITRRYKARDAADNFIRAD